MRVGWIGLGAMGAPMARNVAAAGFDLVAYDLADAARAAAGVPVADSAADAAADVDVLITMLPKGEHVITALTESGALAATAPTALVIDASTIAVDDAQRAAELVQAVGRRFIDAPVSGGVTGAQNGTLTFMTGGAAGDLETAQPLLNAMGSRTFHVGPIGAGQAAKLLNNLMLAVNMAGTCEAAVLAGKLGVDPETLIDIARVSTGDSWTLRNYYPVADVVSTAPSNSDFRNGFAASLMRKDLGLALDAAERAGVQLPAVAQVAGGLDRIIEAGDGALDFSAMVRLLDEPATVTAGGAR
ncbi:3-hydroxyisobutyrate dehydrogenase [Gordonia hydrophobica]|uniref:3-hydroxyisobutyrate dehydrogenase n=1 Tax=Gordonia hydrophobica TaxID=40516 RepID=A0ABZ2U5S2_9ACTN|nr:3-hydroxyisobutyrate dehydrogenase [Gordonia hydrophobica]MBM7367521.1 3-hydroxyisobutyrate dehydrogenase [Gordonia hydrophobica]